MGRETAPPEGEEDMEKTAEQETAKTFQRTRMVVMAAAFAALACVATMVVKVPSPTGGYMNLGDTVALLQFIRQFFKCISPTGDDVHHIIG
mgnify:CR=1 FL=1